MTQPLTRFLHASDTHLTGTLPVCRKDPDWLESQASVLRFLVDTANRYKVPLVLTGDVFDHDIVATRVMNMTIRELQRALFGVFMIPGNHELPAHRWEDVEKSSIGILLKVFPLIPQIDGIQDAQPFGKDHSTGAPVVFTHQLVFRDDKSRPAMAKGLTAQELLDSLPHAQWIFTGDFHDSYWHTSPDGRHVVNPGCTMVHNVNKQGDEARCALVDIEAGTVEWVVIPDDPAMVSNDHIAIPKERKSNLGAFLSRLQTAKATVLDFKANLEARRQEKTVTEPVNKAIGRIVSKATMEEK